MKKTLSNYPISNLVSLLHSSNLSQRNDEKKFESVENKLFKKHFKVFLKEISIKKWKWNFFSTNPKSNLDLIWHQDNYWKPSPGSTLQGSKLDLGIFDGIDEFFSKILDTCQICSKTWIWNFFIYNQNFAFRSAISLW